MKKRGVAVLFAVIWVLVVTILYCTPGTKFPKIDWSSKIFLDKWIHLFLFFLLVILWCRVYFIEGPKAGLKKKFIAITFLAIGYGVVMELIQHFFIPLRSLDFGDMVANTVGALAGYLISVRRLKLK